MDRGNYYPGCQARDSSGGRAPPGCGSTSLWKDRILVCGGKDMPGKDRILLCGGKGTSGRDRILPCGGNVTPGKDGILLSSGKSHREETRSSNVIQAVSLESVWQSALTGTGCPWGPEGTAYGNVQPVTLESARQPAGTGTGCTGGLGGDRGSVTSRVHDWFRTSRHDQKGEAHDGGQAVVKAGVRYAVNRRSQQPNVG